MSPRYHEVYRPKYPMKRWRILHKPTNRLIVVSANTVDSAVRALGWQMEDIYWTGLGKVDAMKDPIKYVVPKYKSDKGE